MTTAQRYEKIAFVASAGAEAQAALAQLTALYGNHDPADADVVVALGGDGLMLQTLHQHMRSGKPIYGMHRGTVGFLMNEFSSDDLRAFDHIKAGFAAYADQISSGYPHMTAPESVQAARNLMRDGQYGWNAWTWARLQSGHPAMAG